MDMDKKKREQGRSAVSMFHNACTMLATLVNEQLFEGSRSWYWVADDIGGLCDLRTATFCRPKTWCASLSTT